MRHRLMFHERKEVSGSIPPPLGGGNPPSRGGHHAARNFKASFLPGVPLRHGPGGPAGAGGDGREPGNPDEHTALGTDQDPPALRRTTPNGDQTPVEMMMPSMSINKWAKPLPKLDLPHALIFKRRTRLSRFGSYGP